MRTSSAGVPGGAFAINSKPFVLIHPRALRNRSSRIYASLKSVFMLTIRSSTSTLTRWRSHRRGAPAITGELVGGAQGKEIACPNIRVNFRRRCLKARSERYFYQMADRARSHFADLAGPNDFG